MMAPERPTPQLLALDAVEELSASLIVAMGDHRDAARIYKRWAVEKDAEADRVRARLNRLSLVRARILRAAS